MDTEANSQELKHVKEEVFVAENFHDVDRHEVEVNEIDLKCLHEDHSNTLDDSAVFNDERNEQSCYVSDEMAAVIERDDSSDACFSVPPKKHVRQRRPRVMRKKRNYDLLSEAVDLTLNTIMNINNRYRSADHFAVYVGKQLQEVSREQRHCAEILILKILNLGMAGKLTATHDLVRINLQDSNTPSMNSKNNGDKRSKSKEESSRNSLDSNENSKKHSLYSTVSAVERSLDVVEDLNERLLDSNEGSNGHSLYSNEGDNERSLDSYEDGIEHSLDSHEVY